MYFLDNKSFYPNKSFFYTIIPKFPHPRILSQEINILECPNNLKCFMSKSALIL